MSTSELACSSVRCKVNCAASWKVSRVSAATSSCKIDSRHRPRQQRYACSLREFVLQGCGLLGLLQTFLQHCRGSSCKHRLSSSHSSRSTCTQTLASQVHLVRKIADDDRLLLPLLSRRQLLLLLTVLLCCCRQVLGLQHVDLIAPEAYPRFTLIRQAWGSLLLGLEALRLMVPEVSCCYCCGLQD